MIFENYSRSEAALIAGMAEMVVNGVSTRGVREILGFDIYPEESTVTWMDFLEGLKKRVLYGPLMITSDAHGGIKVALQRQFPETTWQRCQFHFSKNIVELAPKKYQAGLQFELNALFQAKNLKEAIQKRYDILQSYGDEAERAMKCLEDGFEDAMTVLLLPIGMRRFFRTSNHIERINRELKRRSNVIGVFPNEVSLMRLIGSTRIELNENVRRARPSYPQRALQR
jgi:putative transposase